MRDWYRSSIVHSAQYLRTRPEVMGVKLWWEVWPVDLRNGIAPWHEDVASTVKECLSEKPIAIAPLVAHPHPRRQDVLEVPPYVKALGNLDSVDFVEPSMHEAYGFTEESYYRMLRMLRQTFDKPVVIGESDWFMNPAYTLESVWAAIMSGVGGIKIWGYLSDYHLLRLRPTAWLCERINFSAFGDPLIGESHETGAPVRCESPCRFLIDREGRQGLFRISGKAVTLEIRGLQGSLPCFWYDPWTGRVLKEEHRRLHADGTVLDMPAAVSHEGSEVTVLFIGSMLARGGAQE